MLQIKRRIFNNKGIFVGLRVKRVLSFYLSLLLTEISNSKIKRQLRKPFLLWTPHIRWGKETNMLRMNGQKRNTNKKKMIVNDKTLLYDARRQFRQKHVQVISNQTKNKTKTQRKKWATMARQTPIYRLTWNSNWALNASFSWSKRQLHIDSTIKITKANRLKKG